MRHLSGIVELVRDVFSIDDSYVWILSVRFVDEEDCYFVVFCCHCGDLRNDSLWGRDIQGAGGLD